MFTDWFKRINVISLLWEEQYFIIDWLSELCKSSVLVLYCVCLVVSLGSSLSPGHSPLAANATTLLNWLPLQIHHKNSAYFGLNSTGVTVFITSLRTINKHHKTVCPNINEKDDLYCCKYKPIRNFILKLASLLCCPMHQLYRTT